MRKIKFEIREIEAWAEPTTDGAPAWSWNTSYNMGTMETGSRNPARALAAWLKRNRGIVFYPARVRYYDDGEIIEIQDRKTGEPLFAAIPQY